MSALIIEVHEAEPLVARWRKAHDPVAAHGIPPHVTALYPFIAPGTITEADAARIRDIVCDMSPWEYQLTAVREFPTVVWLQPKPAAPFRNLTRRLWAAFPDYPPFGGMYKEIIPHLTIAHVPEDGSEPDLAARIAEDLEPSLPVVCSATNLALYESNVDRHEWQCTHRFPFRAGADLTVNAGTAAP